MSDGVQNELDRRPDSTVSDRDCPECDGTVWDLGDEQVCGKCSTVANSTRTERRSIWSYFFENRSEYDNSGNTRCVGGFPWVYEWVESEDIEGPVADVDATKFYR